MAQTQFDLDLQPAASVATTFDSIGFEIGWDHAHYRLTPPVQHLLDGHPVRQGWQAGVQAFGRRTLQARPSVRAWLALRLQSWAQGRAFEPVQVTPNFLAQIDTGACPVTGEPAAEAALLPTPLNPDAGCAAGNLVMLGERARRALAGRDGRAALATARRLAGDPGATEAGLGAAEWMRLAVLVSFATPMAHAQAAALPLVVLPPNRLRVLNAVQALQTLLTLQFTATPTGRRIADLAALMPGAEVRRVFQVFMNTLLARRVAAGRPGDTAAQRRVMEEAWTHPLVQRRWESLALRLGEVDCLRIVEIAAARGLVTADVRMLPRESATDGWALDTRGRIDPVRAGAPAPASRPAAAGRRPQPRPLPVASGTTLRS